MTVAALTQPVTLPEYIDNSPVAGLADEYRKVAQALIDTRERLDKLGSDRHVAVAADREAVAEALASGKNPPASMVDGIDRDIEDTTRELDGRQDLHDRAYTALAAALRGEDGVRWITQAQHAHEKADEHARKVIAKAVSDIEKATDAAVEPRGLVAVVHDAIDAAHADALLIRPNTGAGTHDGYRDALSVLARWPADSPTPAALPVPVDDAYSHELVNRVNGSRTPGKTRFPELRDVIADVTGTDPGPLTHFVQALAVVRETLTQEQAIDVYRRMGL